MRLGVLFVIYTQLIKRNPWLGFISGLIIGYLVGSSSILMIMAILGCVFLCNKKISSLNAMANIIVTWIQSNFTWKNITWQKNKSPPL